MLLRLVILVYAMLGLGQLAQAQDEVADRVVWKPSYSGSCQNCNLVGQQMPYWDVRGVRYDGSDLSYASLYRAVADQAHFTSIKATRTEFSHAQLVETNFTGAVMDGARLIGVEANGSDFSRASLDYADLLEAKLIDVNLSGASLAHGLCQSTNFSNASATGAVFDFAVLRDAIFDGSLLSGASFIEADVSGASFKGARLHGANLARIINSSLADFSGACRSDATLLPPGLVLPLCEDASGEPRLIDAP
ncbi:MAG: pentapeptide repeat-containing protein [Pseudomonadota bacterium]